jgi:V8-like Glu-specific endopeptidase
MIRYTILVVAAVVVSLASTQAFARPLPKSASELRSLKQAFASVPTAGEFNFSGIVSLGNCSGSIIRFTSNLDAKALVLTNGHCVDMMDDDADAVYENVTTTRTLRAYITYGRTVPIHVTRLVYGIMQPHDLAMYELSETYRQLQAQGVRALELSPTMAPVGEPIVLASGLFNWAHSCSVEAIIYRIKEDKWVNEYSYKYHCNSGHGTSGSPLVSDITGLVVGVNYTGNDDGEECTFNNPCEIDEHGNVRVEKGAGYGDQTYKILTCVDAATGQFSSAVQGCALPRPNRH